MSEKKTPIELGFGLLESIARGWYQPELHISIRLCVGRGSGEVWFEASWDDEFITHRDPNKYTTWHEAYEAVAKDAERFWNRRKKEGKS